LQIVLQLESFITVHHWENLSQTQNAQRNPVTVEKIITHGFDAGRLNRQAKIIDD
jgi:hypothetical protein